MEFALALRTLVKLLVLPPAGPLILALVGLAMLRRWPRAGRALAWAGAASLFLLSLPVVAWLLTSGFDRPPLDYAQAHKAQAIVILGGGTRRRAPEYGGDTLGRLTLERVRYGAQVARRTGLPVLVTGGRLTDAQTSEAALMRDALGAEFGVAVRWSEDAARNTHENARNSARVLKSQGIDHVLLVAHAIDMPRATAEFADAGIATIPAATGLAPPRGALTWTDFVPSVGALQLSHDALYEVLANVARALPGQ